MSEKGKSAPTGGGKERSFLHAAGSNIWYFFNSLKLTLGVLITLALVSIIGTVIEQNQPVEQYLAAYGDRWTGIIFKTGLHNMYHSWWFLALLAMLALNIVVCTFERFPPKWKSLLNHIPDKFDPRLIDKLAHNKTVTVNASASTAVERMSKSLKKKGYCISQSGSGSESFIYAWRGRVGRLGSDFVHISLLLILLGAIIGSYSGFKSFDAVYVGDLMKVPTAEFKLRLDKFWIDYYDTGQVRQYNSMITIVEGGKEVLTKQIWVNEPLSYKGIRFYQSSYGMAWNKVEEAQIGVRKKGSEEVTDVFTIKWNEKANVPGTPYDVKLVGYTADYEYDKAKGIVTSKSAEPNNPAVMFEIYEGADMIGGALVFLNHPGLYPSLPESANADLVFGGYKGIMYSGISINKDPGTNVVWAGSLVMGLGFYLAFFVYHRRVWVHVRQTDKSVEVKFGGMINKNTLALERELDDIADSIVSD